MIGNLGRDVLGPTVLFLDLFLGSAGSKDEDATAKALNEEGRKKDEEAAAEKEAEPEAASGGAQKGGGKGLRYAPNDGKHGPTQRGKISAEPTNPEKTLENSIPIKGTSTARVGVDASTGEYVMFRQSGTTNVYHGYATKDFNVLPNEAKAALQKSGLVSQKGKIQ